MTTVIYNHKENVIGFDSRVTDGNGVVLSDDIVKMTKTDKGTYFFAGAFCDEKSLIDLVEGKVDQVQPKLDGLVIAVIDEDVFICGVDSEGYVFKDPCRFNNGIGTGRNLALAALDFESNCTLSAMKYAIKKDCFSGGTIRLYCVKTGVMQDHGN